jgi:ubiquitin C-terminal hydrolase
VFTQIANKYFHGYNQHDSQEALSCIIDKIIEELSDNITLGFKINDPEIIKANNFRNKCVARLNDPNMSQEIKAVIKKEYETYKLNNPDKIIALNGYKTMCQYINSNFSIVTDLFTLFEQSITKCPEVGCNYFASNFSNLNMLHLPTTTIDGKINATLEECLKSYIIEETLDENNKWYCPKCDKKVCAKKQLLIWENPKILIIHLSRFKFNGHANVKDSRLVNYPVNNLDLSDYMSPYNVNKTNSKYHLISIINHKGSYSGGHYFATVKTNNKWFKFDDSDVSYLQVPEKNNSMLVDASAYVLVYMRNDMFKE